MYYCPPHSIALYCTDFRLTLLLLSLPWSEYFHFYTNFGLHCIIRLIKLSTVSEADPGFLWKGASTQCRGCKSYVIDNCSWAISLPSPFPMNSKSLKCVRDWLSAMQKQARLRGFCVYNYLTAPTALIILSDPLQSIESQQPNWDFRRLI